MKDVPSSKSRSSVVLKSRSQTSRSVREVQPLEEKPTLFERLNTRLFELPRASPSHEIRRDGPFRLLVVRALWALWFRILTPTGRYFMIASGLFFLYGLTSLEFQAFVPFSYASVVWILTLLLTRFERPQVNLLMRHPERIAAGEGLTLWIDVESRGRGTSGGAQIVAHALPPEIDVTPEMGTVLPLLARGAKATVSLQLHPQKRGVYRLRGARVESDFPFGLVYAARVFEQGSKLLVYPRFDPLDQMDLPMGMRYQPGGVAFVASRGESVEYIGNRDYREGDNVRDIDWRATARLNRPIVREYREEYFLRAAVILDTHVPSQTPEACEDFERAISVCAACGDYINRADYLVDLLAAGPDLYHLMSGRGLTSLDQVLDILACVDSTRHSPWVTLTPEIEANLERITSVICIFLDWDEERRQFASNLAQSGAALKIIIVRDPATQGPPTLDPARSWPGEVIVLGSQEFAVGVRQL